MTDAEIFEYKCLAEKREYGKLSLKEYSRYRVLLNKWFALQAPKALAKCLTEIENPARIDK